MVLMSERRIFRRDDTVAAVAAVEMGESVVRQRRAPEATVWLSASRGVPRYDGVLPEAEVFAVGLSVIAY